MEEQYSNHFNGEHDTVAKFHADGQRVKRVIKQDNVSHAAGGIGATKHCHAKVGLFERQGVVNAVAYHAGKIPMAFKRFDNPLFLFG